MAAQKRIGVYPGSFDPVTRGHLDIIARGADLFDRLVVGVLANPEKAPSLSPEERVELIRGEVKDDPRVEVRPFEGLVARLCDEVGARWILRGVRSEADLTTELPMALSNRLLGKAETVFLPARAELAFISSRLVRDIARLGGDLSPFLTPRVAREYARSFRKA